MKRMVSLLLTLVLALLLAGCGGNAAAAADSAAAPRDNGSGYWNTTADTDSISEDQNMAYEAELRRTTTAKRSPTGPLRRSTPATWRCRRWTSTRPAATSTRW